MYMSGFNVEAQRSYELQRDLKSPSGRYEVGQTMLEPFREGRDYVALGRKVFAVDHVQPGAPMWYDKDPQFSALTISTLGGAPRVEISGERVELVPFPIAVLVRIPVIEVATRRFDILNREQVRARAEMAEIEDAEVLRLLETEAAAADSSVGVVTGAFSLANFSQLFANVEQNDAPVENVIMHAQQYRNIRTLAGDTFDPVTRRELLKTGYMGDLWGAAIRITKQADTAIILAAASPEFLGVISVRIDLDQMDSPQGELLQYGWVFYEYIGIAQLTTVGSGRWNVS